MGEKQQRIEDKTHEQLRELAARSVLSKKPESMKQIIARLVEEEYQKAKRLSSLRESSQVM